MRIMRTLLASGVAVLLVSLGLPPSAEAASAVPVTANGMCPGMAHRNCQHGADSRAPVAQPSPTQPSQEEAQLTRAGALLPRDNVVTIIEQRPGLLGEARVKPLDAQHVAQTRFPNGFVEAGKIEQRPQGLLYAFVIRDDGKRWEVLVSAVGGDLIGVNLKSGPPR